MNFDLQLSVVATKLFADRIHIVDIVDSTNSWLVQLQPDNPSICIANQQTNGSGRRGKHWLSDLGNLYLSMSIPVDALTINKNIKISDGLSLITALAVRSVIAQLGIPAVVKWSNDVLIHAKKCAGILLLQEKWHGQQNIIIGIGVNNSVVPKQLQFVVTSLREAGIIVTNTQITSMIVNQVVCFLHRFCSGGFSLFRDQWLQNDCWYRHNVCILQENKVIEGKHCGVDQTGRLIVRIGNESIICSSGEVSIRRADNVS